MPISNRPGYSIGSDGAVIGPDGNVVIAPGDPRNRGNLVVDSLGNVVDPDNGAVVLTTLGFEASTTVTRPPTPVPAETPVPSEEPPDDAEGANGDSAEARLWRAVALQSVSADWERRHPNAPDPDDDGAVDV